MKQKDFSPLVLEAAKTKQIDIKSVEDFRRDGPDIFLTLAGGVVVRVEISALPAGLLESSVPVPETAQVVDTPTTRVVKLKRREPPVTVTQVVDAAQPPAKANKKRSRAKHGR